LTIELTAGIECSCCDVLWHHRGSFAYHLQDSRVLQSYVHLAYGQVRPPRFTLLFLFGQTVSCCGKGEFTFPVFSCSVSHFFHQLQSNRHYIKMCISVCNQEMPTYFFLLYNTVWSRKLCFTCCLKLMSDIVNYSRQRWRQGGSCWCHSNQQSSRRCMKRRGKDFRDRGRKKISPEQTESLR